MKKIKDKKKTEQVESDFDKRNREECNWCYSRNCHACGNPYQDGVGKLHVKVKKSKVKV